MGCYDYSKANNLAIKPVVFEKLEVFKPVRIDYHFLDRDDMTDPKDPHRITVIEQGRLIWNQHHEGFLVPHTPQAHP